MINVNETQVLTPEEVEDLDLALKSNFPVINTVKLPANGAFTELIHEMQVMVHDELREMHAAMVDLREVLHRNNKIVKTAVATAYAQGNGLAKGLNVDGVLAGAAQ